MIFSISHKISTLVICFFMLALSSMQGYAAQDISAIKEARANKDWMVGPVTLDKNTPATYCSMKNKFDNKAELVFAKDQSGAFSLAIDFGEKLLQEAENYAVNLSIPPDVVRQTAGQAVAADILVIQLGFDQVFMEQIARRSRLDIGLDGHVLSFSLNGTGQAVESLLFCATNLNQDNNSQSDGIHQAPQLAEQAKEPDPALEIKKLREENERLKAEQELKIQKEAERLAAEQKAREEAERLAAEQKAREEAERLAAEQKAREEAERLAAEQKAREEAERLAAEQKAREEAERLAAEQKAREEAERLVAEQKAREEAERLAAEQKAREEAERLAAEQKAKEQARIAAAAVPLLSTTHSDFLRLLGVNQKLDLKKVQDNYFVYSWTEQSPDDLKLSAAAHFMPRPYDKSFLNLTDNYQRSIASRCLGDFAFNKADVRVIGDYVYQLAETACITNTFKLGAALIIIGDNNNFVVLTYETKVENMMEALATRDRLLIKVEDYLRQYPRFIFSGP